MNLIMKDHAEKIWLKRADPVTKNRPEPVTKTRPVPNSLILSACATAIVIMMVVVTLKTALASPEIKINHYALVDQNGEE